MLYRQWDGWEKVSVLESVQGNQTRLKSLALGIRPSFTLMDGALMVGVCNSLKGPSSRRVYAIAQSSICTKWKICVNLPQQI
jgi:hypothetical protein